MQDIAVCTTDGTVFPQERRVGQETPNVYGKSGLEGDWVNDEYGFQAVFTEQGASASHMVAAKTLDGIARMPGMAGSAADARSAYTQVHMSMVKRPLQLPDDQCPEIWVSLPQDRWPKEWQWIEDPAVPLLRNLYGHPLAGLLWEIH